MTDKLSGYSTTPASNNAASPDGWPEGMTAGSVNNSDREFAARVREFYEDSQWIDYGHTIVSSTGSSIKLSGDVTTTYTAGRAIRVNQSASQDGWVSASAYSAPDTSITVTGFTVAAPTQVEVGAVKDSSPLPASLSINSTITAAEFKGSFVSGAMIASAAQVAAATADDVIVTPSTVQSITGIANTICKVTGRITNGACTLANNTNVTSVTRNAAGVYAVVIASDYSSADYSIFLSVSHSGSEFISNFSTSQAAGAFTANIAKSGGAGYDPDYIYISCYGTLA